MHKLQLQHARLLIVLVPIESYYNQARILH